MDIDSQNPNRIQVLTGYMLDIPSKGVQSMHTRFPRASVGRHSLCSLIQSKKSQTTQAVTESWLTHTHTYTHIFVVLVYGDGEVGR